MPDTTTSPTNRFLTLMMRGDLLFAVGVVCILLFMLVPLPPFLLDMGLSLSIAMSVVILMTALFLERPLDFSTFPTVLLITTAMRLGLNIASTRLILENGHLGKDAAGGVIEAFGHFMIGDNYIVGAIVFAILVIVNFVVITKGSGRIAEVAARFTLDAMPGKQMAIDSDMSSGMISEDEARKRRKELEQESTFFGAMDGAAKFVRGDAIAGLMVVFINLVGGIVIGVLTKGLSLAESAANYSTLTIGDGLVSQIPALIISIASGLLVSKAGVEGAADKALIVQFSRQPKALGVSGVLLVLLSVIPGMPFIPFFSLGTGMAAMAFFITRSQKDVLEKATLLEQSQAAAQQAKAASEEPVSKALAMDTLRLELGYGLLALVKGEDSEKLTAQIKGLRRQLAEEMGYLLPSVRIQDNLQLPSNTYTIRIKEIEAGRGDVRPNMMMCMDPAGGNITLPGENTVEPTFGLPAMWIDRRHVEEASFKGYTVVDAATVITTHITEIIKDNMQDLLSYAETQKLLDEVPPAYQKLVADTIPSHMTVGGLQRILQNLVGERVSIRDLPTILEGIAEATSYTKNIAFVTEHVRSRLARQLCDQYVDDSNTLLLATLSPEWESAFAHALVGDGEDKQLAMPPTTLQDFIQAVRKAYDTMGNQGLNPALVTSPMIRPYVRSIVERFRPQTAVLSQNEIHPKARIRTVVQV